MRILLAAVLAAVALHAAEPDWKTLDPYAVDLLQRYLRIDTSNPPANTTAAAALIKSEFEKRGFTVQLLDAGNGHVNFVTRLAGRDKSKKPLLLLNHIDVVPVDRKAWSVDPFGGIIKDGEIWGRGSLDMKGTGVQQMAALMAMKDSGTVPARDIVLVSTCDEEAGGTLGVKWILAHHPEVLDVEYSLDEGGFMTQDVLSASKRVAGIAVGEKQIAWLKLTVKGTAGHGSQPIADNANDIMLRAIRNAMALPESTRKNDLVVGMQRAVGSFADNKFTHAIQGNTMTLTSLRSGVGDPPRANVIPSLAEATLDCRLLPGVNADEFVSEIRARINDPHVKVETLSEAVDPGATDTNTPLFAALRAAILKQHPDAAVMPMLIPYGTDSAVLRKRGVKSYGFLPMTVNAKTMVTFHSDEERIPVNEFTSGIHMLFDVLRSDF